MRSNIELEKQLFLLKLDLPLLKGKNRAITEYQDEGAIYQFAFDNIPDGGQVRTKTELLNEFSVRGIAFEPRPFGGIYACRVGTVEVRLDSYCCLSFDQYSLGSVKSKEIDSLSDFIRCADNVKSEAKAVMQDIKMRTDMCDHLIHSFHVNGVKDILNLRKKDKDWNAELGIRIHRLETDLGAFGCLDSDTIEMIVSSSSEKLMTDVEKAFSDYVTRKQNQARKKGFAEFEKKLAEALDGYDYTISRYKPMYGTESFRLNVKLPHGIIEYKSSLYIYNEKLPGILRNFVPVAVELSTALGKKITEKSLASFQDKLLLERYAKVQKPASKCGIIIR